MRKKMILLNLALAMIVLQNCTKKDDNDDQTTALLLLAAASSSGTTCNVSTSTVSLGVAGTTASTTSQNISLTSNIAGVVIAKGLTVGQTVEFIGINSGGSVSAYKKSDCNINVQSDTIAPTSQLTSAATPTANDKTYTVVTAGDYVFYVAVTSGATPKVQIK